MRTLKKKSFEDESKLRTLESQTQNKTELLTSKKVHSQGYKSDCILNELENFEATENYV